MLRNGCIGHDTRVREASRQARAIESVAANLGTKLLSAIGSKDALLVLMQICR